MAENGLVNRDSWTLRQSEIIVKAAQSFGINPNEIVSAVLSNGLPEYINAQTTSGNYSRSVIPLYGELLTDQEQLVLRQNRLEQFQDSLESLNGVANLLGRNRQPIDSISSSERRLTESVPTISFDPSIIRRTTAGLPPGAQNSNVPPASSSVQITAVVGNDHRVRITVPGSVLQGILTTGDVLAPLRETNGVLFPYTPSISVNHTARYNPESLTHSNYYYHFYQASMTEEIQITATFAVKNGYDATYVVAAQHFFRTVTKMFYGQDDLAGVPPPVLRLEGHGKYQFNSVPVVITSFSVTLPDDVDYITTGNAATGGGGGMDTRVPAVQQFNITCAPIYSRSSISQRFSLRQFAAGALLGSGTQGGFI